MLIASNRPESLLTVPSHPHPHHHPNPHIQTHQGGQSIANKGQRQSGIWHKARDHAEVHRITAQQPANPSFSPTAAMMKSVWGSGRNPLFKMETGS